MKRLFACSVLLLLSTAVLAQENESPEPSADRAPSKTAFTILDANSDGYIDQKEAKADQELDKEFAKIANQGKVDEKAFYNWKLKAPAKPDVNE